jgi:integrase
MAVTRRNGRWQARYRDETGGQHAKMFDRKIDAQRWEVEELARLSQGTWVDPRAGRTTFREYSDEWLTMQPLRPTTLLKYEQFLRLNINPRLGERPLTTIRRSHIQAMIAALSDRLSPGVVRSNAGLTSSILKAAVLDRRLATNPCVGVKLPEVLKDRVEVVTTEQVMVLRDAMGPEWQALIVLGAGAGLRQGEALGVTRDRIDFLRRQLRVDRQLMNLPNQAPRLVPVKTKTSTRTIPLPQVVVDSLAAHLAAFPTDDLIFPPITRQLFSKLFRAAVTGRWRSCCGARPRASTTTSTAGSGSSPAPRRPPCAGARSGRRCAACTCSSRRPAVPRSASTSGTASVHGRWPPASSTATAGGRAPPSSSASR